MKYVAGGTVHVSAAKLCAFGLCTHAKSGVFCERVLWSRRVWHCPAGSATGVPHSDDVAAVLKRIMSPTAAGAGAEGAEVGFDVSELIAGVVHDVKPMGNRTDGTACPTCKQKFQAADGCEPWLYLCGHSACGACNAAVQKRPACPVCLMPGTGAVINTSLLTALVALGAAVEDAQLCCIKCAEADDVEPATQACGCCDESSRYFCDVHGRHHVKKAGHSLSPLGDAAPGAVLSPRLHCGNSEHASAKDMTFCVSCRAVVCTYCLLGDHRGHDVKPLPVAAKALSGELPQWLKRCESAQAIFARGKVEVQAAIDKAIEDTTAVVHEYDRATSEAMEAIVKSLLAIKAKHITAANTLLADRLKALNAQLDVLSVTSAQLEAVATAVRARVNSPDPSEVVNALHLANRSTTLFSHDYKGPVTSDTTQLTFSAEAVLSMLNDCSHLLVVTQEVRGLRGVWAVAGGCPMLRQCVCGHQCMCSSLNS